MHAHQHGLWLGLLLGALSAAPAAGCPGDCDRSCEVTVAELVTMVNIALGEQPIASCTSGDTNGDGMITVNEIIAAVNAALNGCECSIICGDGLVVSSEECDDGGICVGGTNAGTACTRESDCQGEGGCDGGSMDGTACGSDFDCKGAKCIHCKPVGGDGCAANCTLETDVTFDLVPGQVDSNDIRPGTSGIVIHGDILNLVPLSGRQALTVGKAANGLIPVVIKAASMRFPAMHLVSLSCFCLRGVAAKTCGGTLLEADGVTPSTDCTETFTPGDSVCAGKKPCTSVYGPGNAAAGVIGSEGLDAVDIAVMRDCGTTPGAPPAPVVVTASATGGPGSARFWMSTALGSVVGLCNGSTPEYGPDGDFCTSDDPVSVRGSVSTFPITTASVTATVLNSRDTAGATLGPFSASGAPFSCVNLEAGQVSGAALVGSFTACDQPTVGDAAFAYSFVAR